MTCPSPNGIGSFFCFGDCDPDTCQEVHKEAIAAREYEQSVCAKGAIDIILNGSYIGTINLNAGSITNIPAYLSFAQFEYINNILQAIAPITTKP